MRHGGGLPTCQSSLGSARQTLAEGSAGRHGKVPSPLYRSPQTRFNAIDEHRQGGPPTCQSSLGSARQTLAEGSAGRHGKVPSPLYRSPQTRFNAIDEHRRGGPPKYQSVRESACQTLAECFARGHCRCTAFSADSCKDKRRCCLRLEAQLSRPQGFRVSRRVGAPACRRGTAAAPSWARQPT